MSVINSCKSKVNVVSEESRTEQVTVRMTVSERETAEKLGQYLHKAGKLDEPSVAGALRVALRFTVNEILKSVEAERYG